MKITKQHVALGLLMAGVILCSVAKVLALGQGSCKLADCVNVTCYWTEWVGNAESGYSTSHNGKCELHGSASSGCICK